MDSTKRSDIEYEIKAQYSLLARSKPGTSQRELAYHRAMHLLEILPLGEAQLRNLEMLFGQYKPKTSAEIQHEKDLAETLENTVAIKTQKSKKIT